MAKKGLLVLLLAATVTAGSAFAQMKMLDLESPVYTGGLADGIGGNYAGRQTDFSLGGGFILKSGKIGGISANGSSLVEESATGVGAFIFGDATYLEIGLAFMGGSTVTMYDTSGSLTSLDLSLLGKYPIGLGKFTVSPLLGVGLNIALAKDDGNGDSSEIYSIGDVRDYSQIRIQLGVGGEYDLTQTVYIGLQVLGNYGFAPLYITDMADQYMADAEGGFGVTVKLAAGFRY